MARADTATNLLDMVPERKAEWITGQDDLVRIQIHRYGASRLGRWVAAWMGRRHIYVKLDEIGSEVWRRIDGDTTVGGIGEHLGRKFGDKVEPVPERMAKFFNELERSRWIAWR